MWIDSESATLLRTGAAQTAAKYPQVGRAEALRRAMLPLMNVEVKLHFAHAACWASLTNIGEVWGSGRTSRSVLSNSHSRLVTLQRSAIPDIYRRRVKPGS